MEQDIKEIKKEAKKETYDFLRDQIIHASVKPPTLNLKDMSIYMDGYRDSNYKILDLLETLETCEMENIKE